MYREIVMADSWTCIMVEKGPGLLDDSIGSALRKAACVLSHKGLDAAPFREKYCEGFIETNWKLVVYGSKAGIVFRTQVAADGGEFKVNFLMSREDLKRGADILRAHEEGNYEFLVRSRGRPDLPELMDFSDLSSTNAFG